MGYNDRARLSDFLDDEDWGIEKLMQKLLTVEDFLDIWRACRGGCDPAMGLIFTLAQSKLTTLEEFESSIPRDTGSGGFQGLLDMIKKYPGYLAQKEKRLDKLPFDLLGKIASEISAKPKPTGKQNRPLWKTIASNAGLSPQDIKNLDMPASRAWQRESMTMKFIEIVNQRYPKKKVSWLIKGLLAANRNDVIDDTKLFGDCRKDCCKHLFPPKN